MLPKMLFLTSLLVALDVASGLNIERLRAVEPLKEGVVIGYSIPGDLLKRQSSQCPIGTRQCARTSSQVLCAGVCCFEDGVFSFGCEIGYYCDGTGANAGCCPVGRICSDVPPCVDYGVSAPSPTSACPAAQPTCTENARGAPLCVGEVTQTNTMSFTLTRTSTTPMTMTSEGPVTITTETESTTEEPEPTTTEETTTEDTVTFTTTTSEIPAETTTTEVSTTEADTTTLPTTTYSPTQPNATLAPTPLPPTTSNSGRTSTVNLSLALIGVAFAFFSF